MKRYIFFLLTALVAVTAVADDDGYLPLVREGVRWLCLEKRFNDLDEPYEAQSTYYYEFRGDTVIADSQYLKLYRVAGDNNVNLHCDDVCPVAYMRNDAHKVLVYADMVDKIGENFFYDHNSSSLYDEFLGLDKVGDDFVLYDFDSPTIESEPGVPIDPILIGEYPFVQPGWSWNGHYIIYAGIGLDCKSEGDPFTLVQPIVTSPIHNVHGLIGLFDLNGQVLYKGMCYDEHKSEVSAVRASCPAAAPRWYDLMGRAFEGKPTQPGIYVHQGQKVVVR